MSHMIGRPDDGVLDIMLGQGADPEQAVIDGSDPPQEPGDGAEALPRREEPAEPES